MSVEIINDKLCIVIDVQYNPEQELLRRMHALIHCIQNQKPDMIDEDTLYYSLDMLKDMLPSEDLMEKMFVKKGGKLVKVPNFT